MAAKGMKMEEIMGKMDEAILRSKKVAQIREIAKAFGIEGYERMKKKELLEVLINGPGEAGDSAYYGGAPDTSDIPSPSEKYAVLPDAGGDKADRGPGVAGFEGNQGSEDNSKPTGKNGRRPERFWVCRRSGRRG
jgi:hypothetical protein